MLRFTLPTALVLSQTLWPAASLARDEANPAKPQLSDAEADRRAVGLVDAMTLEKQLQLIRPLAATSYQFAPGANSFPEGMRTPPPAGNPTFVYQFSVVPKAAQEVLKGAVHASEREYVFQTLGASDWPTDTNDAAQARLIDFTGSGPVAVDIPRAAAIEAIATAQGAPIGPATTTGQKND